MFPGGAMNKPLMLLLAATVLIPAIADAQRITGVAVEESTRMPVRGALVELIDAGNTRVAASLTDSIGRFSLAPARGGDFVVRLSHIAYVPLDSLALTVRAGETMEIELRVADRAIPVEPLVIRSFRDARLSGFHDRMERRINGRFVSRDDIEKRRGMTASELLRGMPGVHLLPAGGGFGVSTGNIITMRGGVDRCLPTVYLDGIAIAQFPENPVDDFIFSATLEGIEVYVGSTAPSPFRSITGCGVVAFWTRSPPPGSFSWRKLAIGAGLFAVITFLGLTSR
jgi:hypothetical protein